MLFRISKISTFESNSQQRQSCFCETCSCSEYQRYQLLRAIHNLSSSIRLLILLFRISKISTFESNSQPWQTLTKYAMSCSEYQRYQLLRAIHNCRQCKRIQHRLFRISKISTFESNSQQCEKEGRKYTRCSEYQRYQLLRAIHNTNSYLAVSMLLFRISKISTFESNSQLNFSFELSFNSCSEYQRYQLLRAIHNEGWRLRMANEVVPNIKDINFWEQFTTWTGNRVSPC